MSILNTYMKVDSLINNEDEPSVDDLYKRAVSFATKAHEGQVRKYDGSPYVTHPIAVSKIVASVTKDPEILAAAVLHDVLEDTKTTKQQLSEEFTPRVADLVDDLTNISRPEDGSRSTRKSLDRKHTAQAHPDAKTIKLADLLHNTVDIMEADKKFAKIYMSEKRLLLDVLSEGHPRLYKTAVDFVDRWLQKNPN